jgi:undecaprenyl-diphosphatase
MSLARFTAFNLVGAAIWSAVFCAVGYFFGQHPPAFGPGLARGAVVIALGLGILAVVAMAGGWLVEESDAAWRAEGSLWHRILTTAPLRWLGARSPRAQAFLFRRFTPGDYLGLNLTLGLGLSFVALVIFGAIAKALLAREAIPEFDLALARALRAGATPAGDAFWRAVSSVGSLPAVAAPGLTLAVLLAPRRGWLPFGGWAASLAGASLLDLAVKHFYAHPHGVAADTGAITMGTPSGQALGAVVGLGMTAYFVVLLVPGRRTGLVVVAAAALLVFACSFGRLYLGERYFSDVVSGLAAGGVWLAACLTGLEVARRRDERGSRQRPGRRTSTA